MSKKTLLLFAMLFAIKATTAQVTDPMITNWWFNNTNNQYKGILTDVEAVFYNTQNMRHTAAGSCRVVLKH